MTDRLKVKLIILLSFALLSSAQKPRSWFSFFDRALPTTSTTPSSVHSTLSQVPIYTANTSRPSLKSNETGLSYNRSSAKPQSITPLPVETTRALTTKTSTETPKNRTSSYSTTTVTTKASTVAKFAPVPTATRSSSQENSTVSMNVPVGRKAALKPDTIFPDYETNTGRNVPLSSRSGNEPVQIPMALLEQLDQVGNIDDFMRLVDNAPSGLATEPETDEDWAQVDGRFGWTETERNSDVINPKAAGCTPENQTVPLSSNENPLVMYYPTCTRIERCGGCCSSRLLSCEPTKTETLLLRVVRTEYTGGTRLSKPAKEIIPVERHLACKCQCRVKESDCSKFQVYEASSCTCKCTSLDDKVKCERDNRTRIWDSTECVCRCRDKGQCSTGYYFDEAACQCESLATGRHGVDARAQLANRGRAPVSTIHFEDSRFSLKNEDVYDNEDKPEKPVEKVQLNKPRWNWH